MSNIFQEKQYLLYEEKTQPVNAQEFRRIVENRRSVRVYDGSPIPESVVRDCLDLALLAPNSSNLQPWEFLWVRTEEKKKALAQLCFGQPAATTAAELIVCLARTNTWKENRLRMIDTLHAQIEKKPGSVPKSALEYYKKLVPLVYNQGPFSLYTPFKWLFFTVMGFFRLVPREPLGRAGLRLWAAKTTALACENLMLAFSAHGYDSCPMEGFDACKVKSLLALPSDAYIVMIVSAGKRKTGGIYGPRIRFAKELFLKEI